MRFLPSTSFLPEQEAAVLLPELARVCRQLGVVSVRASVVDVETRAYRAAWSITETGSIAPTSTDRAVALALMAPAALLQTALGAGAAALAALLLAWHLVATRRPARR